LAAGYKVRLADGSEIGPMDLEAVRTWFDQGLIDRDSPILKPGSKSWTKLSDVLGDAKRPSQKGGVAAFRTTSTRMAPQRSGIFSEEARWPGFAAGGLLAVLGLVSLGFGLFPEHWIPALSLTPFRELGGTLLVLGLGVVAGWRWLRKLARLLILVMAFALFPLAGILLAGGAAREPFLVLGGAFLFCLGVFGLLAEEVRSILVPATWLIAVVGGLYGIVRYGFVPVSDEQRKVRELATADRTFSDPGSDFSLEVPRGWVILKKDQNVVAVPPEARLVLAEPGRSAFAFVAVEKGGGQSADEVLTRFLTERRRVHPDLKEDSRTDVTMGHLPAREARSAYEAGGTSFEELDVVWMDGWVAVALSAWIPKGPQAPQVCEALARGVATDGNLATRLHAAVSAAIDAAPHLDEAAVQLVMGRSAANVLEPQEVFRRSCEWANRGVSSLSPVEAREMAELNSQVFSSIPSRDRGRLAAYFDRVKTLRPTSPEEDRDMERLMRSGVLRLPGPRLLRLRALYEKLIRSAAEQS
jgi:hypothetical protein